MKGKEMSKRMETTFESTIRKKLKGDYAKKKPYCTDEQADEYAQEIMDLAKIRTVNDILSELESKKPIPPGSFTSDEIHRRFLENIEVEKTLHEQFGPSPFYSHK